MVTQESLANYAKLQTVIGRSSVNANSIALHYQSDTLLQVAETSIIVSHASSQDLLQGHLIPSSQNTFTCVSITSCGRYAVTGESGHRPCVRVWQLCDDRGTFIGKMVRAMSGHSQSVSIVKFTPDDSTLISIGNPSDSQIITWDWKTGENIGAGKLSAAVNAMSISFDSSMCVTVGIKSVKYWFLPMASDGLNKRSGLTSRSAILADKRNVNFVDVAFCDDSNRLVAVTSTGEILEFNGNKKYVKCYSWKISGDFDATCVSRIPEGLLVGCTDGLIRLFCLIGDDLDFLADLAPPMHLFMDPSLVYDTQKLQSHSDDSIFAEPRCILSSVSSPNFIVVYADRTIVEFGRDSKTWSFKRASLSHVGAINSIETYPSSFTNLPAGTVITSGNDGTIRFWNIHGDCEEKREASNILCPSLLKVIYLVEEVDLMTHYEGSRGSNKGIMTTRVAYDGRTMVAGSATGILYLIDLSFSDTPIIDVVHAHDSQVSALDFSDHASKMDGEFPIFLVSGGIDGLIKIFKRVQYSNQFSQCAVSNDHQLPIKSVKFLKNGDQLQLFSCSSDGNLIIWEFNKNSLNTVEFLKIHEINTLMSINNMQVMKYSNLLTISGNDRIVRQFDLNAKPVRDLKSVDEEILPMGEVLKVIIDPTATFSCSICSDRRIYVCDVKNGSCLAVLAAFASNPTDVMFSEDFKNIYVTTSSGTILVWKLATNLTERIISVQVRLMEEVAMRTSTPDSLLGSGSEVISESNSLNRPLGAPEFSGSSTSLYSDDDSSRFSSSISESRGKKPTNYYPIGNSSFARVGDSSFSPSVQPAAVVERRTLTNIFSSPDQYDSEISESQSDFVSARRSNRLNSEHEENLNQNLLGAPSGEDRRSASPSFYQDNRNYQSSKSMMNLRDINNGGGGVRVPTAKELMMSHIASQRNSQSGSSTHLSGTSGRMKWGDMPPAQYNDWQPTPSDIHYISPAMATSFATPIKEHRVPMYGSPDSSTSFSSHPPPLTPRTSSRVLSTPPSQNALRQIQEKNHSQFRTKSADRNSLSRTILENGAANREMRTVWSPNTIGASSAPRKSNSNLFLATNQEQSAPKRYFEKQPQKLRFTTAVQSRQIVFDDSFSSEDDQIVTTTKPLLGNRLRRSSTVTVDTRDTKEALKMTKIGRKPDNFKNRDDDSLSSVLRSRSQSPNKLAMNRDLPSSPSSTGGNDGSRSYQQRRRDSDVSYIRSGTRGRDEMRKSTDALNKLMAVRSKLHQSTENLRKSTENLALLKDLEETSGSAQRTRSISNIRSVNENLGTFGAFDADSRMKSGSTSSLAHSRMLARSAQNLCEDIGMEGSTTNYDSPSKRMANTIQMMRKASNSDLTAPEQYSDTGSPFANRMRGAVQKKMDRYRQRNKNAGRHQTSEESDSNNSDMIPMNINKRMLTDFGGRSTTASDCSPASSTRSSSLAMSNGGLGSGITSSRRLYDQHRLSSTTTPRKNTNYMVTKMSEQSNLESDDSPQTSTNSQEWRSLIETSNGASANQLICHVKDCMEQLRITADKSIQAKKLVKDDCNLSEGQKRIIFSEIDRSIEQIVTKLTPIATKSDQTNGNVIGGGGNDYTPLKGANIYSILKENLNSRQ